MTRKNLKILSLTLLVILGTSCDLTTKWIAKNQLKHAAPIGIVNNYFELRYTENTAIAFSMLHSIEPNIRKWIIYSLSLVAIIFLCVLIGKVRNESFLWLLSLMLVLSGAIGNLSERIFRGYVIDFLHLHYYDKWSWPIFNVADILITCGAILLGILMLRNPSDNTKKIMDTE